VVVLELRRAGGPTVELEENLAWPASTRGGGTAAVALLGHGGRVQRPRKGATRARELWRSGGWRARVEEDGEGSGGRASRAGELCSAVHNRTSGETERERDGEAESARLLQVGVTTRGRKVAHMRGRKAATRPAAPARGRRRCCV
jgi:hypothetical protein